MRKRGANFASNPNNKRTTRFPSDDEDYSDEDYVLDEAFLASSSNDDDEYTASVVHSGGSLSSDGDKKKKTKLVRRPQISKDNNYNTKQTRGVRLSAKRTKLSQQQDYDFDDQDDNDNDEDDDEEFNPNEIDFVDHEEDLQFHTDNKHKKVSTTKTRNHPNPNSSKLLNKPIKKKQKLLVRKPPTSDDDDDDDFDFHHKGVLGTRNKSRRRNKKSLVQDWDSDVASSDFDYTVSDEDKELLREANDFIGNSTTRTRNTRLHVARASNCHHLRPMGRKGKEKVASLQDDAAKQVCGICFSEEAKGIARGTLNCCTHYFCFACILEWSKVESRCPLCKQRFLTISKPARPNLGVDLRNTVLQVPKCDQVYQPSEEEVMGYLDPYDGVVCMECQLGGDDSLMLLCDICDSPAHTYCVGLGREVPEGNWYCKGCRVSDMGSTNVQVPDPRRETRINNVEDSDPTPQLSVSASSDPSLMNEIGILLPSPRYPVTADDDIHLSSPTGLGVSTLSGRRRIHRQIRNLLSNNRMTTRTDESEVVADSEDEHEQMRKPTTQHAGGTSVVSSGFNSAVWAQDGGGNPSSTRSNHLRRPSTIIVNGSSSGDLYVGLEQRNSVLVSQQLRRCPYNQADDGKSPRGSSHFQREEGTME